MALRREILSYMGTGALGVIAGYYIGAQELLGIQSEERVVTSNSGQLNKTQTEEPTEETDTATSSSSESIPESIGYLQGLTYYDGYIYFIDRGVVKKYERSSNTVVNSFDLPPDISADGLAFGVNSLWFTDLAEASYDGTIVELNPETGEIRSRINISWDPSGLTFGNGSLWAINITSNEVVEFTPDGEKVSSFRTDGITYGVGLAYFDGSIWLGNDCTESNCTVSLFEYDTSGNLIQETHQRSGDSVPGYRSLAATESELLGMDSNRNITVLRTSD